MGPPLQQPPAQEVESHTHCPLPLHSRPDTHAAHAAPAAPHEEFDSDAKSSHVPELQQPGQLVPPHVQAPPEQLCPPLQAAHAFPPAPHRAELCAANLTQELPLQQPVGHELGVHAHWPVVVSHV